MDSLGSPPTSVPPLDQDLLRRAREGDVSAESALFSALDARIRAVAKKRVWDPQAAEDIAQETLKTIYEKYRTADLRFGLLPWAFTVFHHKVGNYLKSRRADRSGRAGGEARESAAEDGGIAALEAWEPIEKALRLASDDCRKIFRLLLLGADRGEILGAFPGERPGTIDSRVSRCRKRLLATVQAFGRPEAG